MSRFLSLILCVMLPVCCAGCSVTYPLWSNDTKKYLGQTFDVRNRAYLLTSNENADFEIAAGQIWGSHTKRSVLPTGTPITIHSFWRNRRWYLIGGLVTTDYAWVSAETPSDGKFKARLSVAKFDAIFDESKYRPALPEQVD